MKILKEITESEGYSKYKTILKSVTFDPTKALQEVQDLHLKRKSRTLYKKNGLSSEKVSTASLMDQSYRSRIVELLLQANWQRNMLSAAHEALISDIVMHHHSDIPVRAKQEKRDYIESNLKAMAAGAKVISGLDNFAEIAGLVQEDIDQAQWTARNVMKGLEIGTQREVNL